MEDFVVGVFSSLVASAFTTLTGEAGRRFLGRPLGSKGNLSAALDAEDSAMRARLATELASRHTSPAAVSAIARFLLTPEASEVARAVTIGITADEVERVYSDVLRDHLKALLILTADIPPDAAAEVAEPLLSILIDASRRMLSLVRAHDPERAGAFADLALSQRNAGYLKNLSTQTAIYRSLTQQELIDAASFATDYLPLARRQYATIEPPHLDDQRLLPLDDIYVEPRFIAGTEDEAPGEPMRYEVFKAGLHRSVVLGDPGAGKSTLSRKLIYDYSAPGVVASVPFLVELRPYQQMKMELSASVLDYVVALMRAEFQLHVNVRTLEYLAVSGKAIFIFDGLDELLDTNRKREMVRALENFAQRYPMAAVTVTSRRVGYREASLNPASFEAMTLAPLTSEDVQSFVSNWFRTDAKVQEREQQALIDGFLTESESVGSLRSNPLMLSLLCNVYRRLRSIPENRAALYEQCAALLFDQWDSLRGVAVTGALKSEARLALQEVALWIYERPAYRSGVVEREIRKRLARFWRRERYESDAAAQDAALELLAMWEGRSWVLAAVGTTPTGESIYRFSHETFLEYFAAAELTRRYSSPRRLWRALRPHVAQSEWDVVAQIAVQLMNENVKGGANEIIRLLVSDVANFRTGPGERLRLLSFASRYLEALRPAPEVARLVVAYCLRLAIDAQPVLPELPRSDEYDELCVPPLDERGSESRVLGVSESVSEEASDGEADDVGDEIDVYLRPEDYMLPLLQVVALAGEDVPFIVDELDRSLKALLAAPGGRGAIKAMIFTLNWAYIWAITRDVVLASPTRVGDPAPDLPEAGAALTPQTVRRISTDATCRDFWALIEGARASVVGLEELVDQVGLDALFCNQRGWLYRDAEVPVPMLVSRLVRAVVELPEHPPYGLARLTSTDRSALKRIGEEYLARFRARGSDLVDAGWIGISGLEGQVVHPAFGPQAIRDDEDIMHAAKRGLAVPIDVRDEVFGAACLIATLVESEVWNFVDQSVDQVARIVAGAVSPMGIVFVAHSVAGFEREALQWLRQCGFTTAQIELLAGWVTGSVRMLMGRR